MKMDRHMAIALLYRKTLNLPETGNLSSQKMCGVGLKFTPIFMEGRDGEDPALAGVGENKPFRASFHTTTFLKRNKEQAMFE